MLDKARYVNSVGQVVEFGTSPYFINYNDLRDYEYTCNTSNNRIISFTKEVATRTVPMLIVGMAEEEATKAKNDFCDIVDLDVKKNVRGRLYIGDYYVNCNITASKKSEYLESKLTMKSELTVVIESKNWVKETEYNFKKTGLTDVETFSLHGRTNDDFESIAEDGTLALTAVRKPGDIIAGEINTLPLRSLFNAKDVLFCTSEGVWGINRAVELLDLIISDEYLVIDGEYKTYRIPLERLGSGECKCDLLGTNIQEVEIVEEKDFQEGAGIIRSTNCDDSVVFLEIHGTAEGLEVFSVRVSQNNTNTYKYYSNFTNEQLSSYTYEELSGGVSTPLDFRIFSFHPPLYEGDYIKFDDGEWRHFRSDGRVENSIAFEFKSYAGDTVIEFSNDFPVKASFKTKEWYNNRISNTEFLNYPLSEFAQIAGEYVYIRLKDSDVDAIKLLYKLKESYFYALDETASDYFGSLAQYDDVQRIIATDEMIVVGDSAMSYPRGYNRGYGINSTGETIFNDASAASSAFKLIIYGPCVDPVVTIGNQNYSILDSIEKGEYVVIDALEKTVIKYKANGTTENIFHKRYKAESVFEPIPTGNNDIAWNREFAFDIIYMDERSEPKWT